jgi:hypothetical protein
MLTLPRPNSTASDLLRLAALWLVAILLVQGFAAALALGAGPRHHHRPQQPAHAHAHDHIHAHGGIERHHHARGDGSVVTDADTTAALDAAALALAAALTLLAANNPRRAAVDTLGHVRRSIEHRRAASVSLEPHDKPPRPA